MQDTNSASASFREVDEHGNALPQDPASAPEGTRRFRVNPFILALWVLNGALLVIAGWAYNESFGPMVTGAVPDPGTGPLAFVLMNAMPQLLVLCVVSTIALLFWHAWQWQKRRAG